MVITLGLVATPHIQNTLDSEGQRKNQPMQTTFAGVPRERFHSFYKEVAGKASAKIVFIGPGTVFRLNCNLLCTPCTIIVLGLSNKGIF